MRKIIAIILIILMITGAIGLINVSCAAFKIDEANLYSKGYFEDYLNYGDVGVIFNYVVYKQDGKEYPAYCLNKDLDGVTGNDAYSVETKDLLTDVRVWRAIINGFPYKTPAELGCETEEEAFIATKQAVYCMLYDRDPSAYNGTDTKSLRVLNALTQIVTNTRNSNEVKQNSILTIEEVTNEWEQDKVDSKYISKVYKVSANAGINSYKIKFENIKIEGAKITDEKNQEKTEFKANENFKILIPINNLQEDGNFEIKAEAEVATKPVIYGYSQDRNKQDYAITGSIYEDGTGKRTVYYIKNETKIKIIKKDDEGNFLEGVKFNLLDKEKKVIFADLTTNKNGECEIQNLIPDTYYIEETYTHNGYAAYNELIEANVEYNEALTVTVVNSKEKVTVEKPKIEKAEKEVITENKEIVEVQKIKEAEKEVKEESTTKIEKQEIKESKKEVAIKLPKTGM